MYIVDANIVFSALLSPTGMPSKIVLSAPVEMIIAPDFLKVEISKHYPKLLKIFTKGNERTEDDLKVAIRKLYDAILFYSEAVLTETTIEEAKQLVADIDPKDYVYVAFALFFKTKLWSGDKELAEGLKAKGIDIVATTFDVAIAIMK